MVHKFTSADRPGLIGHGRPFKKRARVIAIQVQEDFVVETEHGVMSAHAGDWLVTNHPDDDPSSDVWPVSHERFTESYVPAREDKPAVIQRIRDELGVHPDTGEPTEPADRPDTGRPTNG